jgi:hypothetical protein
MTSPKNELPTNSKVLPPAAFSDDDDFGGGAFLFLDGKRGPPYTCGRDKDEVPCGTKAVAFVDQQLRGFTIFEDGVPRSRLLPLWPPPDLDALRASLGNLDPDLWPNRDPKGQPLDPWRPTRRLPLVLLDATSAAVVFSTCSDGGNKAVGQLGRAVKMRRLDPAHADALPLISLEVDSYPHPNKQFGTIFKPLFDIDGWTTHRAVEAAMRSGDYGTLLPAPVEAPRIEAEPARAPKAAAQTTRRAAKEAEGAPWEEDNDRSPEAARQRIEAFRSKARRG